MQNLCGRRCQTALAGNKADLTALYRGCITFGGKGAAPISIDFESLFASSPNPYVVLDSSLRLVWMNEAYLRVTMRTRGELLGQRMFDAFPSDPRSESYRLLKGSLDRVLATGETDELALVRYDIRNADGTMDIRFWSATHTPLRDATGAVAWILQHTVDVTELEDLRRLRDEMGVVQRASAVQQRNRSLVEETDQLRSLFEQAPGFIAILQGPELRFVIANAAYRALVGRRDLIGLPLAQALPEVVDQGFAELLDQVLRSGEPFVGRRVKVTLENAPAQHEERYLDFIYQPIVARDGQVSGIFVQGHDVTEEVEAEERQKLLINELNHRVKNTLAVVQGLAMQSFRSLPGAQEARVTFDARLNALAAAHSLLTDRNWDLGRAGRNAAQLGRGHCRFGHRPHCDGRARRAAPAADGRQPGDGPARAEHQRDQVRRAVGSGGPCRDPLVDRAMRRAPASSRSSGPNAAGRRSGRRNGRASAAG